MNKKEIIGLILLGLALVFFGVAAFHWSNGNDSYSQHMTTRAYVLLSAGVILMN